MKWTLGLCLLFGCGQTVFVDPDAARKAELTFAGAERLVVEGDPRTYLMVRVRTRGPLDDVRFSVTSPSGTLQLPTVGRDAVPCRNGQTCLSYTLGLGLPEVLDEIVLEAPGIGHRATAPIVLVTLGAYATSGAALAGNASMEGQILDPIRSYYAFPEDLDGGSSVLFPRRFQAHLAPGACSTRPAGDDPGWRPVAEVPFRLPATFSPVPEALSCLSVRPEQPAQGPVVASATINGRAVLQRYTHLYAPPRERSPLVYQLLFDLEMASEARCTAAKDLVAAAIADTATAIASDESLSAEVLALDPIDIAVTNGVPCRQNDNRRLDIFSTYAQIQSRVADRFGDRGVRIVFIYATNLNLPMPVLLQEDLSRLFGFVVDPYRSYTLFIAPDLPAAGIPVDTRLAWTTTQEPSFRDNIASAMASIWPFSTMVHRDDTFVPLLPEGQGADLLAYRLCEADQPVVLEGAPTLSGAGVQEALRVGPLGPGYRVSLFPQWLIERSQYAPITVRTIWEGCSALCDRPPPGGLENASWLRSGGCQ